MPRPVAVAAAGLALFMLAGCNGNAPLDKSLKTGSIAERVPVEQAFVDMPPGGPPIQGVVQRNYANSVSQEIVLGNNSHTPGQNSIQVSLYGPVASTTGPDNTLGNDALSLSRIGREMASAMPGVGMKVSPFYAQNNYGAFGYASGLSPQRDMCLYAWQRIRAPDLDSTVMGGRGTIQIRLRLCSTGATEADLLSVMTGFTISTYFRANSWNPFGDPLPPAPELGKPGTPMLPTQAVTPTPVAVAAPVAASPAPTVIRRVKRIVPQADEAAPAPDPAAANLYQDYTAVPPP